MDVLSTIQMLTDHGVAFRSIFDGVDPSMPRVPHSFVFVPECREELRTAADPMSAKLLESEPHRHVASVLVVLPQRR